MSKYIVALIVFICASLVLIAVGPAQIGNPMMFGPGGSPPAPPATTACTAAVPSPAHSANFNTLAYCADFSSDSGTNNVVNATPGNKVWSTRSNWLDCAGATGSAIQWTLYSVGHPETNPCGDFSIVNDPLAGSNALRVQVTPADGDAVPTITTGQTGGGSSGNAYYEIFPRSNMLVEIKYRVDASQPIGINPIDFWSWWRADVAGDQLEMDFVEIFGAQASTPSNCTNGTGAGISDWGAVSPPVNIAPGWFTSPPCIFDSNYHTVGVLSTSHGAITTATAGYCIYYDGLPARASCAYAQNPHNAQPAHAQGYLVLWNKAVGPPPGQAVSSNVNIYVQFIRVWSCTGWNTIPGSPGTTSDTCDTNPPFNSTPP